MTVIPLLTFTSPIAYVPRSLILSRFKKWPANLC